MCLHCHQQLTNEEVLRQMQGTLVDPKFNEWNETSINHLIITMLGYNGKECAAIAKEISENFLQWKKSNANLESNCCATLDELTNIFNGVNRVSKISNESNQEKDEILKLWNTQPEAKILLDCSDRSIQLFMQQLKESHKTHEQFNSPLVGLVLTLGLFVFFHFF